MASSKELGRRIEALVRQLTKEFGELPESDEPLMTRIEDWAIDIGDAVMTRAVERKLQPRSSADSQQCCPTCGRPGRCKGNRQRVLQTRRGEVRLEEPEYYCAGCRKSFFPDIQGTGD